MTTKTGGETVDDTIPLDERQKLILMAAYFHGGPPYTANCGRVLGQALLWASLLNDERKEQLMGSGRGDTSVIEAWYDTLIVMTRHFPSSEALIQGAGNFGSPDGDPPAWPAFTSCGLTDKGRELAERLLAERPNLVAQSKQSLGCF